MSHQALGHSTVVVDTYPHVAILEDSRGLFAWCDKEEGQLLVNLDPPFDEEEYERNLKQDLCVKAHQNHAKKGDKVGISLRPAYYRPTYCR